MNAAVHTGSAEPAYTEAVRNVLAYRRLRELPPPSDTSAAPTLLRQHFTVARETSRLQMLAWSEYVGRILDVPVSRAQVARGFRGEIDTYVLRNAKFLDSRTDPMSQIRSAARISTDQLNDYIFHIVLDGIADTQAGTHKKSTQFTPGVLALDMCQPMVMRRPTKARVMAFFLPRAMVEAAIPDAESLHGNVATYHTPLMQLLRAHLLMLSRELPAMSDNDAQSAIATGTELVLAAFGKTSRLSHSARAAARAAMLGRIQRYIRANLHSRELEPEQVLRGFPITRPTLYRMFEPEGGLQAFIRNCRLREAANRLVHTRATPIAQIADALGFSCASDFTRAFRRAYGVAPLEFRALGLDWLRDNTEPFDAALRSQ
ncbi:helix-turn-helix transcriptional regulator [Dyella sp. 2RAB6]|uniref:AraC family transcriptional regulator n=1 Tax=Dyella sp. 2RAB6 TaxID=3232992 RepID=UPI003F92034E